VKRAITPKNVMVAVYPTHTAAESAVKELEMSAFNMNRLSVVGRGGWTANGTVGYYSTGDRIKYWGKLGAFWGAMCGLLAGSGYFSIPDIGSVIVAGPLVDWIIAALKNAAIFGSLSALGAALYSVGIPRDNISKYEAALRADKFMVVAYGSADEVARARRILETVGTTEMAS
jgi:hypothetical protein